MADSKVALTISRHWHSPQIHTVISEEGIALALLLADYEKALTDEMYQLGRWFTREQLEQKIRVASLNVIKKVKEESTKAV